MLSGKIGFLLKHFDIKNAIRGQDNVNFVDIDKVNMRKQRNILEIEMGGAGVKRKLDCSLSLSLSN